MIALLYTDLCLRSLQGKRDSKAGEIPLRVAADIQKVDYNKKKNCFQIVTPERIYHIRCDREDELVDWVNSIRKQQAELLYPTQKGGAVPAPSATAVAPTAAPVASTIALMQSPIGAGMSAPGAPAQPTADVRVFVYGRVAAFARVAADVDFCDCSNRDAYFALLYLRRCVMRNLFQFGDEKRAGATVDDFELLKVIGKGSFGKVCTHHYSLLLDDRKIVLRGAGTCAHNGTGWMGGMVLDERPVCRSVCVFRTTRRNPHVVLTPTFIIMIVSSRSCLFVRRIMEECMP